MKHSGMRFHAPGAFIGEALKGAAVVNLLQTLNNTANGRFRERPLGEIFSNFMKFHARWFP
jgi:hypothetical protein